MGAFGDCEALPAFKGIEFGRKGLERGDFRFGQRCSDIITRQGADGSLSAEALPGPYALYAQRWDAGGNIVRHQRIDDGDLYGTVLPVVHNAGERYGKLESLVLSHDEGAQVPLVGRIDGRHVIILDVTLIAAGRQDQRYGT